MLFMVVLSVASASCPSAEILHSSTKSQVERGGGVFSQAVLLHDCSTYPCSGTAEWIWEAPSDSLGAFNFYDKFFIPSWVRSNIDRVTVTIGSGDDIALKFNGVVLEQEWRDVWPQFVTYDLTPHLRLSDYVNGFVENVLAVGSRNRHGGAGVAYQVDIFYLS